MKHLITEQELKQRKHKIRLKFNELLPKASFSCAFFDEDDSGQIHIKMKWEEGQIQEKEIQELKELVDDYNRHKKELDKEDPTLWLLGLGPILYFLFCFLFGPDHFLSSGFTLLGLSFLFPLCVFLWKE